MERIFAQEFRETIGRRFRTKSLYIAALFLLVISLVCAFSGQAMINLLGYEFSMIISLILSQVIAGMSANEASHLHKGMQLKKFKNREFAQALYARKCAMFIVLLFLAAIPFIVILLNAFRVVNCNILQGIWFYLLIPVVTGFVSIQLTLSFTLFSNGNARKGYLWFLLYSILTVIVTVWKLYAGPRVSFFNFILGSIVLFNYNTVVPIDTSFLLARSLAIVFGYLIFFSAVLGYERNRQVVACRGLLRSPFADPHRLLMSSVYILMVIYLIILFAYKGPLGIDIDTRYVKSLLDGEMKGKGIILRFPSDSPVAGEMERILKEHEWHYQRIVEELELNDPPVVVCYIYPTRSDKSRLTGVGGSVFAKPWQAQIHVEYSEGDIRALKHELTHILAGEFGRPVVNISLQTGLCEGLSEAVEWQAGALTHHQWAKEILKIIHPEK